MLKIKSGQIRMLADALRAAFVDRMRHHLPIFFPEQCDRMGDAALRELIADGIARAALYGITTDYGVCLYLYIMMRFGSRFDEDPSLGAIRQSLACSDRSAVQNVESIFDLLFSNQAAHE